MKKLFKKKKIKKNIFVIICLAFMFLFIGEADAFIGKIKENNNPKLANYFLQWTIDEEEAKELAKWDLLVLDMEVQENSLENFKKIREYNPDIIILAYVSSSEIRYDLNNLIHSNMRKKLWASITDDWWLKSSEGWKLSAWPKTYLLNITDAGKNTAESWNAALPDFVSREILSTGLWDGVFYDNIWHDVSWINEGNMDIDNDLVLDSVEKINNKWVTGVEKMLSRTRNLVGDDFIVMGNGSSYNDYQPYLNGIMFENFPTPWESGGVWSAIMEAYARIKPLNVEPNIHIVNSNSKEQDDYFKMRSALGSTLLTDSYFSFDYDTSDHSQTWWYDEYDTNLGKALGDPIRVDGSSEDFPQGVWRRDFQNGIVYLNSHFKEVRVELPTKMKKIEGEQDKIVNDGGLVNYLILGPTDGIILRNILKVYDIGLLNKRNYKVINNLNGIVYENYSLESNYYYPKRRIKENSNGKITSTQKEVNFVDFKNDDSVEKVIGSAFGKKSFVNIFNSESNKLIGIFSAYPERFSCGVKTAVGDVDGDGEAEIVVVPAYGGAHLKIFTPHGELKEEFFFMDEDFRGKYDLVLADVNNDSIKEILVTNY